MKILVLNCGSSSVKYQLIEMETEKALAKGSVQRIGMSSAVLTHEPHDNDAVKISGEILDHQAATEYILAILISKNHGVIEDLGKIDAVGHRMVHGGEEFKGSILVTEDIFKKLRALIEYAPLHNPHNLKGINAAMKLLPGIPNSAVFDTAFHHSIPEHAYMYPLPRLFYNKYKIRRYGFHGTSHFFVYNRTVEKLGIEKEKAKVITCHLGNGSSIAAVKGGKSIDTSMGFTPLEGLVMGTRCGDIDPAIILTIMGREELTLAEANTLLNKHSGLVGLSGISSDVRDLEEAEEKGDNSAKLALDVMSYRIKKYIGAYTAAMDGIDAITFTGGIGENSSIVRSRTVGGLSYLGLELDDELNSLKSKEERKVSSEKSKVDVLVIPTNEELVIARETEDICKKVKQ